MERRSTVRSLFKTSSHLRMAQRRGRSAVPLNLVHSSIWAWYSIRSYDDLRTDLPMTYLNRSTFSSWLLDVQSETFILDLGTELKLPPRLKHAAIMPPDPERHVSQAFSLDRSSMHTIGRECHSISRVFNQFWLLMLLSSCAGSAEATAKLEYYPRISSSSCGALNTNLLRLICVLSGVERNLREDSPIVDWPCRLDPRICISTRL